MKTRLLFLLTLLIVLISSCAQDEMLEKSRLSTVSSQDVTFNASFEDETNDSRTYIEEDDVTSKLYLRWTKGDEISIFRGTTLNQRFQFKGETGDNSGSFKLVPSDDFVSSNELEEARNYAFYPYDEHNKISEKGELTVTLPATQTYAEKSFGLGANAMIALTEHTGDVDLKFKNIGGYFKFKFYGDDLTIKSVTLKGNNGEKLAGKAGVVCQYGDAPIVTMAEEATETLTLYCGAGVKVGTTTEEATEFWFVLPPTKFTKGFTITVTDTDDGTFTKTTEKVFEIKRNTIKPISAMKVETVVDWEAIYAKERAALIDLYNATDGDNWKNNTNWCSDSPLEEWYGLGISEKGRVLNISLTSNNLVGDLPESLGCLTKLVRLSMADNQLTSIPESIGNLTSLTFLYFPSNHFNCNIPKSLFNLHQLKSLTLGGCRLTGPIPEEIGNLTDLESLYLNTNNLSGSIPKSIGNLTKLKTLDLSSNELEGSIPESIWNLEKLNLLDFSSNKLSGPIPESTANSSNLYYLRLQNNQLTGNIPESIGNKNNLRHLYLQNNQLTGNIPESIGDIIRLSQLKLTGNKLSGPIPEGIGNLTFLTELILAGFELSGSIPESIGNLTRLTYLSLSNNNLEGSIPESIGNLTLLTHLDLSKNNLEGSIPESIGNLTQLNTFILRSGLSEQNYFSGNIPASIGNLTKLKELDLSGFDISGEIPKGIGNLTNLTTLNLNTNKLSGSIPESIGNLTNLTTLNLNTNRLNGSIPESIGNLANLKFLSLSNNLFSGEVPTSLMNNDVWKKYWYSILKGNYQMDLKNIVIPAPEFTYTNKNGEIVSSKLAYANNKLTVLYLWAGWCGKSLNLSHSFDILYQNYKDDGLEIIDQYHGSSLGYNYPWQNNKINEPIFHESSTFPQIIVVDCNGNVVFTSMLGERLDVPFKASNWHEVCFFIENELGTSSDEFYTSKDYTYDGEIVTLQSATIGGGINLIFMGDAFVDKDMEPGGVYEQRMIKGMESFFSIEPYKSMRNRFNVYAVKVISPNAEFADGAKHRINDDNSICFEYAQKIPNPSLNPPMVTVIYNTYYRLGRSHCAMYTDGSFVSDILDLDIDGGIILHESGGHGFANLLDEYVETGYENKTLSDELRIDLDNAWAQYGRGANVDWRNDASTVKWSHFLNDSRYDNEGLGLYEGARLYGYGAYRPSENSMMRYNDSPFNAPSREAIYKRIMQLSEGEGWTYDYEEFVKYDEINRNAASRSASRTLTESEKQEYIKNHQPPTIIQGTWRDAIKNKSNIVVPLR